MKVVSSPVPRPPSFSPPSSVILGVVLLIVSLAADVIGIGNEADIGWKQLLGAIVGFLIVAFGGWLVWGKAGKQK